MCAALRLAGFNAETDDEDAHNGFSGLPSPAAGGLIAAIPIGVMGLKDLLSEDGFRWATQVQDYLLPTVAMLLPFLTLSTALLMVSRIRYPHVFNQMLRGVRGRRQLLQIMLALVLIFAAHEMALPLLLCWFAFAAPVTEVWKRYGRPSLSKQTTADDRTP